MKQLISSRNELEAKVLDDESKKRREVLERRPSYRKILNDLSSADVSQIVSQFQQPDIKLDPDHHPHNHQQQHSPTNNNSSGGTSVVTSGATSGNNNQQSVQSVPTTHQQATITVASASPYLKVVPASTIQLAGSAAGSPADGLSGISALAVNTGSATGTGTIVQYHGQDGQPFFVPGMTRATTPAFRTQPFTNRLILILFFLCSLVFVMYLCCCLTICSTDGRHWSLAMGWFACTYIDMHSLSLCFPVATSSKHISCFTSSTRPDFP